MLASFLLSIAFTGTNILHNPNVDGKDLYNQIYISECPTTGRKYGGVYRWNSSNIQLCNDLGQNIGMGVALHEMGHTYALERWLEYHDNEEFADAFSYYLSYKLFGKPIDINHYIDKEILIDIMMRFGNDPEKYIWETSNKIPDYVEKGVIYGGSFSNYKGLE